MHYTCPHCTNVFTAASADAPRPVLCPHCRRKVEVPANSASRWFVARAKKKHGPFTWQQLMTLAARGDIAPNDILLMEGTKHWVRADTLPLPFVATDLTPKDQEVVNAAPLKSQEAQRRPFPWLIAGLGGSVLLLAVGVLVGAYFVVRPDDAPRTPLVVSSTDRGNEQEKKKPLQETPKKIDDPPPPKKVLVEEKKDQGPVAQKKQPDAVRQADIDAFVTALNRQRKSASLAPVTLDANLSRGCEAHARYLARHFHLSDSKFDPREEDSKKDGYSEEGEQAGRVAIFTSFAPLDSLDRWMGRLSSRTLLLNPDIKSIGVAAARNERGDWYCVVDAVRGRGDQIVVYPALEQDDVPTTFSGGPDVPDAKEAAGFPISVAFPPGKMITSVDIALLDKRGKSLDGWLWTPEKPARQSQKLNAAGFIPKSPLAARAHYQVMASAQVDGKPWNLTWSFTTDDDSDYKQIWAKKALARVNEVRALAGLKAVVLDDKLSEGCLKHARYLVINDGHPALQGLSAHKEDLKLPGATPEGNAAGQASNIAIGDYEPLDAVESWVATLYHRVPVLAPNLKSIGFACVRGRRQGWATVMNVQSGRDKSPTHPVFYPAPDQTDVPVNFPNGGEEPNPIPDDPDGRAGYPVTATFPFNEQLQSASGKLTDAKGNDVPCWFSSPDKPANKNYARTQGSTVCLIAKNPLAAKSSYHVEMRGTLAGRPWEKKWKFTTGETGPSSAAAAKAVLERINHFRSRAGVPDLTLDEGLSHGCQAHAEYLVKNADTLKKANASVNDEDPELPWFSADGLRSARQSFVFTNAPAPVMQIDDLMATFSSRVVVLNPNLQRIGYGAAHDVGRGWRCVLDPNGGRGDGRVVEYPAPNQKDVPLVGYDHLEQAKGPVGFPITVAFPQRALVRAAQARLTDADKNDVKFVLSSPEKPLPDTRPGNVVAVHPLAPLAAGQTYSVTVAAIINGKEWRQTWEFTTAK